MLPLSERAGVPEAGLEAGGGVDTGFACCNSLACHGDDAMPGDGAVVALISKV
jgi:hypothetical protein